MTSVRWASASSSELMSASESGVEVRMCGLSSRAACLLANAPGAAEASIWVGVAPEVEPMPGFAGAADLRGAELMVARSSKQRAVGQSRK